MRKLYARKYAPSIFLFAGVITLFLIWVGTAKAPNPSVTLNNHKFSVEYADSPAQQQKGLGGRDSLAKDQSMLFRFKTSGKECFWMKDMRFNLDIIWIGSDRRVVYIEPEVSPKTYPKTYCPPQPAQYVLEVNSGTAAELHLKQGDNITF